MVTIGSFKVQIEFLNIFSWKHAINNSSSSSLKFITVPDR